MKFIHSDLGLLAAGNIVEVNLRGSQANVLLLDPSNFAAFKAGRRCHYHGGLAKRSPVRLSVPRSGHWHAVVSLPAGAHGQLRASIQVLNRSR